jgi:uncharacterized cofD-like protein
MSRNGSRIAPLSLASDVARTRCVAIGGGTGLPTVLAGLREALPPVGDSSTSRDRLTAIVTMTDDGGSSGLLRRQLDMLPTGDVRNCLAALAPGRSPFAALIQHRFSGTHNLDGHPVGNLLLAALTQLSGDFQTAIATLSSLMSIEGMVLPSTAANVRLRAEFADGQIGVGETAISGRGVAIKRLSLDRAVRPVPETLRALINADVITVGPGSLYTSIIPNLLVDGIASTMSGVRATRVYVANLMTEPGETDGYTLSDHLDAIRAHAGFDLFDYVLVNRLPVEPSVVSRYAPGAQPVVQDRQFATTRPIVIERDLTWQVERGKIRHRPEPLAEAILELARIGRMPHTEAGATVALPSPAMSSTAFTI